MKTEEAFSQPRVYWGQLGQLGVNWFNWFNWSIGESVNRGSCLASPLVGIRENSKVLSKVKVVHQASAEAHTCK